MKESHIPTDTMHREPGFCAPTERTRTAYLAAQSLLQTRLAMTLEDNRESLADDRYGGNIL
jgi:hypothetical protein